MSMKNTVDAKAFADALTKVGALSKRAIIPFLEQVCVEFTEDGCKLMTSDLEAWMIAELPAHGNPFAFVFANTKQVMKACRYFSGDLTFTLEGDLKYPKVLISCGDKTAAVDIYTDEAFPQTPKVEATHIYQVNGAELCNRIGRVQYATQRIDTRPSADAVRFQDNRIWCVDGYRLAVNQNDNLLVQEAFNLPTSPLSQLKALGKNEVSVEVGEKVVQFTGDGISLLIRRMEVVDSIKIEKVFPQGHREEFSVNRKEFLAALRYLSEFISAKRDPYVAFYGGELFFKSNGCQYSATIGLVGQSTIEFGFNLRYMCEALEQFKDQEQVTVQVSSPVAPIVLVGNGQDKALVLPVRLNQDICRPAA